MEFYIPALGCAMVALIIIFRMMHFAEFDGPSYFFWIGVIFTILGCISLIEPIGFLLIVNRNIAVFVMSCGLATTIISLLWPIKVKYSQTNHKIDEIMPVYAFNEFHEAKINASANVVKHILKHISIKDIPSVSWLMKIRGIAKDKDMNDKVGITQSGPETFSTPDFNFFIIDPTEYISVMIIKRSITTNIARDFSTPPHILSLKQFMEFNKSGFVKVAMNFRFVEIDNDETILTTETRIQGIDYNDTRFFGCYWRIIYPGSAIIRRLWLDTIKSKAQCLQKKHEPVLSQQQ